MINFYSENCDRCGKSIKEGRTMSTPTHSASVWNVRRKRHNEQITGMQ